jgi:hypothetical protein
LNSIQTLLGTAIDNAAELHSVINVRVGVASKIQSSLELTVSGVEESNQLRHVIESEMTDNVKMVDRLGDKLYQTVKKKEKELVEAHRTMQQTTQF